MALILKHDGFLYSGSVKFEHFALCHTISDILSRGGLDQKTHQDICSCMSTRNAPPKSKLNVIWDWLANTSKRDIILTLRALKYPPVKCNTCSKTTDGYGNAFAETLIGKMHRSITSVGCTGILNHNK